MTLPNIYYALVVDGEVASNFKICVIYEPLVAAMSSNPVVALTGETGPVIAVDAQTDPAVVVAVEAQRNCEYSLTVDGELATTMQIPKSDPMINAIFQSSPTVVQLTDEQLSLGVGPGWFWDETEFTKAP